MGADESTTSRGGPIAATGAESRKCAAPPQLRKTQVDETHAGARHPANFVFRPDKQKPRTGRPGQEGMKQPRCQRATGIMTDLGVVGNMWTVDSRGKIGEALGLGIERRHSSGLFVRRLCLFLVLWE